MTNLDSIFKSRDITLPTKVRLVKAMVFPVVMYGCESWTVKKAERRGIDAFELWCWRRLLRVPWTARRSNQSIQKDCLIFHWCCVILSMKILFIVFGLSFLIFSGIINGAFYPFPFVALIGVDWSSASGPCFWPAARLLVPAPFLVDSDACSL